MWVGVTQSDKLLLSKFLSLSDYGSFTLAVTVASVVSMVSGPVGNALLPRLTHMQAAGDEAGLISLYRSSTQLVAVLALPACITLALYADKLLWVWTGKLDLAQHAAPIVTLYVLGNGLLALAAFPYYLQYAKGNLRLHLIGNAFLVVFLIPAIVCGPLFALRRRGRRDGPG